MINTMLPRAPSSQVSSPEAPTSDIATRPRNPNSSKNSSSRERFEDHLEPSAPKADSPREHTRPMEARSTPPRAPLAAPRPAVEGSDSLPARQAHSLSGEDPQAQGVAPGAQTNISSKNGENLAAAAETQSIPTEILPQLGTTISTNPQALLFDSSTGLSEDWKQRLEEMLASAGTANPSLFLQSMPSVAILTGRLEEVPAAQIPAAITQTPIFQSLLSNPDPAHIINQVRPLGEWLHEMGWSEQGLVVKDPEAFQNLMQTPISLRDLMKAFHVDVNRVLTEASILQETLPLEGVAPYMLRAQRLNAQQSPKIRPENNLPPQQNMTPTPLPFLGDENIPHTLTSAAPKTAESHPNSPNAFVVTPLIATTTHQLQPMQLQTESLLLSNPLTGQILVQASVPPMNPQPVPVSTQLDPLMTLLPQNPELVRSFLFTSEAGGLSIPGSMPQATVSGMPQAIVINTPQTMVSSAPQPMDLLQSLQALHIRGQNADMQADPNQALPEQSNVDLGTNIDSLPELLMTGREESNGFGDRENGNSDQQQPELFQAWGKNGESKAFPLNEPIATPIKASIPPAVMQEIFDKSSILLKDGGGAMRIDLGSKELGELNLAVEVKDKSVEIRIMAPSQQARELLATELPKLREALQTQNLDLRKVDIGLAGNSSWTQTSPDGRSSRGDEYQTFESSNSFGADGSQRSSRSHRQFTQIQSNPRPLHNGAIQVRV